MGKIADAIKKLIDNPDDLSTLPQIVAQVEELEASEGDYQERIASLQDINKKYLAQIPMPGQEKEEEEEEEEPTLEDAAAYLIEALSK